MSTFAKIGATIVILILFILMNSYMSKEAGRVTGAGIFGFIFLIGGLTAVWRSKSKDTNTTADDEKLDKQ